MGLHFDIRVQGTDPIGHELGLRPPGSDLLRIHELAVEVGLIRRIGIRDYETAHTGLGKRQGDRVAQPSAAHDAHCGRADSILSLAAEIQHLPVISAQGIPPPAASLPILIAYSVHTVPMKLTVITSNITEPEPVAILNRDDCLKMGVGPMDRVRVTGRRSATAAVVIADDMIEKGKVYLSETILGKCQVSHGDTVDVEYSPMPESVRSIRKKINGGKLDMEEIDSIVRDIMDGNLARTEIIAFVSSFNVNNSDLTEVAYLTRSMAATGRTVDLEAGPVFDFHSLGGVPGNKITPIVVSIVASEGLTIPKLSSRSVTSACGTSDFVDTFCDVEMDSETLKEAVRRVGGVFACGNEDYAPVGSKIIQAERPMGIDPRPTMLASILSKKVALGTRHLLIDIPMGSSTKIPDVETAKAFADDLIDLGTILGIHVECAVSYAEQPIGHTIGPILEASECISVLENGDGDASVVDKACGMAGILLEMAGETDGKARAMEVLRSGQAHRKFLEIVEAQKGSGKLKSSDLRPGAFSKDVHAKRSGFVQYVENHSMVAIAKGAGAPSDPGAGILLLHRRGDRVEEGEPLFRIYAESQSKLDRAVESARSRRPMLVSKEPVDMGPGSMIVERIPTKEMLDLIRFRNRSQSIRAPTGRNPHP